MVNNGCIVVDVNFVVLVLKVIVFIFVVVFGYVEVVNYLIKVGVNIWIWDSLDSFVLFYVFCEGYFDIVKVLLKMLYRFNDGSFYEVVRNFYSKVCCVLIVIKNFFVNFVFFFYGVWIFLYEMVCCCDGSGS